MGHPCSGCAYWRMLRFGLGPATGRTGACHYLLDNGRMRGCKPGAGCIRRVEKRPPVRR